MGVGMWMIVGLAGNLTTSLFLIIYVRTYMKSIPVKEKAKSENTAKSWALGALTNLAIGIVLLIIEKIIFK